MSARPRLPVPVRWPAVDPGPARHRPGPDRLRLHQVQGGAGRQERVRLGREPGPAGCPCPGWRTAARAPRTGMRGSISLASSHAGGPVKGKTRGIGLLTASRALLDALVEAFFDVPPRIPPRGPG